MSRYLPQAVLSPPQSRVALPAADPLGGLSHPDGLLEFCGITARIVSAMTPHFDTDYPAPRAVALPMAHAYVEQLSWRLSWFRDRVAAADGPPVDLSVESLDTLAEFVAARAHDPGPVTVEPYWFEAAPHRPDWTEVGAEWVEGLAAAVAEVGAEGLDVSDEGGSGVLVQAVEVVDRPRDAAAAPPLVKSNDQIALGWCVPGPVEPDCWNLGHGDRLSRLEL